MFEQLNWERHCICVRTNDAADAEAISKAVRCPTICLVAVRNAERQAVLLLPGSRELLVRQRTMWTNATHGHLAEIGLVAAQGCAMLACSATG